MGSYLRVLSESYAMNAQTTGSDGLQKSLRPCVLDRSSLIIGRVKKLEIILIAYNCSYMIVVLQKKVMS